MKKTRTDNGFAMMLVLIAVAIAVVMGASYISSAAIKTGSTRNLLKATRARYLGESGIQHAIYLSVDQPQLPGQHERHQPLGALCGRQHHGPVPLLGHARRRRARALPRDRPGHVGWTDAGCPPGTSIRTPPYDQAMLSKTPQGYWRFGDALYSGVAHDSSGNGYDLTCRNYAGWGFGSTGGVNGTDTSIDLDGYWNYLRRDPTSALQIKTDLTMTLWVKLDALPSSGDKAVLVTCGEDSEEEKKNTLYQLAVDPNGALECLQEYGSGTDQLHLFTNIQLSTNAWHNLVITRDWAASVLKVYVEGQLAGSWTFTGPGTPGSESGKESRLYVGSAWGKESYLNGRMDELALMNHVLTGTEIRRLYQIGGLPEKIEVRNCVK